MSTNKVEVLSLDRSTNFKIELFTPELCMFFSWLKIKVYNTRCSLDVQGFHGDYTKRYEHLHNLTVGEYFAEHVIFIVEKKINKTVDIKKLNNHLSLSRLI